MRTTFPSLIQIDELSRFTPPRLDRRLHGVPRFARTAVLRKDRIVRFDARPFNRAVATISIHLDMSALQFPTIWPPAAVRSPVTGEADDKAAPRPRVIGLIVIDLEATVTGSNLAESARLVD